MKKFCVLCNKEIKPELVEDRNFIKFCTGNDGICVVQDDEFETCWECYRLKLIELKDKRRTNGKKK